MAEEARMPVLKHYKGNCHVYVEKSADLDMAERIVVNGKCQRPGVCNAVESLLVDEAVAAGFPAARGRRPAAARRRDSRLPHHPPARAGRRCRPRKRISRRNISI